ncbi:hypothetical protein [Gilvibacter sp.]|uniref:hypothetical protein n=1 Tax=Gilvibacter sp. TaxID=2729997 RepID=UPI003B52ACF5
MKNRIELTNQILDNLVVKDIVYAEYASGGAMGNAGGMIIYYAAAGKIIRYETSVFSDSELYSKAADLISGHCFNLPNFGNSTGSEIFEYHDGGFGNSVFLNAHYLLGRTHESLLFYKKNEQYEVCCSVQGVFEALMRSLEKRNGQGFGISDKLDLKRYYQKKRQNYDAEQKRRREAREAREKALESDLRTVVARFGDKLKELIKIINRHDPMDLIAIGCPSDEYLPEARTLIVQLDERQTEREIQTLVHNEFKHWFSSESAGSIEKYHGLAKDIHHWLQQGGLLKS